MALASDAPILPLPEGRSSRVWALLAMVLGKPHVAEGQHSISLLTANKYCEEITWIVSFKPVKFLVKFRAEACSPALQTLFVYCCLSPISVPDPGGCAAMP